MVIAGAREALATDPVDPEDPEARVSREVLVLAVDLAVRAGKAAQVKLNCNLENPENASLLCLFSSCFRRRRTVRVWFIALTAVLFLVVQFSAFVVIIPFATLFTLAVFALYF